MRECKHPTCGALCRREKKVKKVYFLKCSQIKNKKKVVKRTVNRKAGVLPYSELLKLAQMVFNKWIRARDEGRACITGIGLSEQAGHYFPAGSFSGVRFNELNVNGQSVESNCFNGGDFEAYGTGLVARYGLAAVMQLRENAYKTKLYKWSREELQCVIEKYKSRN